MNIEKRRKLLEKQKVSTAKMEMELKIEERLADIERLKDNIDIQDKRIAELDDEIANM